MYQIATLKHYYHPDLQGRELPRFDDDIYETVALAQAKIDDREDGTYYLDHSEIGRPDYLIVPNADASYIASGRNEDMGNYDWDNASCDCGECGDCCGMMIEQDRQYLYDCAVK